MFYKKGKALQEAEKLVSHGKTSQAIKEYLRIIEKEPGDLNLLNIVGDLYVREKNVAEGLRYYHRLADAFTREGFTVKAIAIYKKISKLDPTAVEPILKLAALYTQQGLGREAREQYAQAAELYRRKNQQDKLIEILQKMVDFDPANVSYRLKLAESYEQTGRSNEPSQIYRESAEIALQHGDLKLAESALTKASRLEPSNAQVIVLKARMAMAAGQPAEVETLLTSAPGLEENQEARQLLFEAYLANAEMDKAENMAMEIYQANAADFSPLASLAQKRIDQGDLDAALRPLQKAQGNLIAQKTTTQLVSLLRRMWEVSPQHLPTLELLYQVCEKTADEFTLPEVLEALGHAYVQVDQLEKAEDAYRKLVAREPENEHYRELLNQVLQRLGKDPLPASMDEISTLEMALTSQDEIEMAEAGPPVDPEQAAMVKEAIENSDVYASHHVTDKALAELEKVLLSYPDQIDIHKRILDICRGTQPTRASQAALALARIFSERGNLTAAQRYEQIARQESAAPEEAVSEIETPPSSEIDLTAEVPTIDEAPSADQAAEVTPSQPQEFPLTFEPPPSEETAQDRAAQPQELDLSADLDAISAPERDQGGDEPARDTFSYEEARVEVDFYLEHGFTEEAQKVVGELEKKFPGNQQVNDLRCRVEDLAKSVENAAAQSLADVTHDDSAPVHPATPEAASEATFPVEGQQAAPGSDILSNLAGDLASSLDGIEATSEPTPSAASEPPLAEEAAGERVAPLSGLLEELGDSGEIQTTQDDPETHYNLGVAFREMGLLDEAIGEFQKLLKGAQKDNYPPHFLQACTLLAQSFMDKNMPAIAAKWYKRALDARVLDADATLALHYDLGVAYEQAGDTRTALEQFTEVYSQNIDYRDVAEKIRELQQRVS